MIRLTSIPTLAAVTLLSATSFAAVLEVEGQLDSSVKVSDSGGPISLLGVALEPSFGRHGFAQSRASLGVSQDFYVDEVRVAPYRYDLGWVAVRAGGVGYDYKPSVDTQTAHVDLGGVDLQFDHRLGRRVGVFARSSATFSVAQWTQSSMDPMTDVGFELFLCGSASRLEGEVGIELDDAWALVAQAGLQGDPVHFTDGANCLGDPPAFSTKQEAGLEVRYRGRWFHAGLRGGWEEEGLHIDRASEYHTGVVHGHDDGHDAHDIVEVASTSALVASASVGIHW